MRLIDPQVCEYTIHSILCNFTSFSHNTSGINWTDKTLSVLDRHGPNPSGFDLTSGNEVERCGVGINEVNVTELCVREECLCGLKSR